MKPEAKKALEEMGFNRNEISRIGIYEMFAASKNPIPEAYKDAMATMELPAFMIVTLFTFTMRELASFQVAITKGLKPKGDELAVQYALTYFADLLGQKIEILKDEIGKEF